MWRSRDDERAQNDALTASVQIGAPPRVIVASAVPAPPIAAILTARGVRTTVAAPASLPRAAADYAAVDAVVLDDVPANLLGASQVGALAAAVQDGGLGLLTLGGRHAYSLGGYAHSALDRLLPVASLSPGDLQRRRLAVELVLDRSGSMADTAGGEGIPKMTMAKSAARQTAEFVSSRGDELGIVGFDSAPQRVLAMQRVTPGASMQRVLAGIGGVTADGGTDIYRGLEAGLNELLASKSPNRHMILLTDGISQEHDYTALLERLKRNRIAVATVALGTDVDAALLRRISKATGGNAYATKLAADLPRIFVKETRLSTEPIQIVGAQQVLPRGTSPIVRSLVGVDLPPLSGNVVTRLRPGAQVDLIARSGSRTEPALAQWGYGTGRVVSWTPGLGAPWATRWTAQTALWNDAVRWAARGVPPEPAAVTAAVGTAMALEVDLAAAGPTPATSLTAVLAASRRVRPARRARGERAERVLGRAPGAARRQLPADDRAALRARWAAAPAGRRPLPGRVPAERARALDARAARRADRRPPARAGRPGRDRGRLARAARAAARRRGRALPGLGRGAHARAQGVQATVTASSSACASSSSSGSSSLRTRR